MNGSWEKDKTHNIAPNTIDSHVLIRKFTSERVVMHIVTRNHTKYVLNYEYLTTAQIGHIYESVHTCKNVMRLYNKVLQHFLRFAVVLLNVCNNRGQT